VGAITQHDADSRWALVDARELYTSAEARASAITEQEEELATHAHRVNQREQEVEKLEGLLQEWEELDDITLR
jgi:transposase